MTSLVEVESIWEGDIRNVRDGFGYSVAVDQDSLGFFQQRPFFRGEPNWGCRREQNRCTLQQRLENIMYAPHALTEFLDEAILFKDECVVPFGFEGEVCLSNEDDTTFGAWCQAVQVSGFPFRYQPRLDHARELINA
jgi:hypothetical protein